MAAVVPVDGEAGQTRKRKQGEYESRRPKRTRACQAALDQACADLAKGALTSLGVFRNLKCKNQTCRAIKTIAIDTPIII